MNEKINYTRIFVLVISGEYVVATFRLRNLAKFQRFLRRLKPATTFYGTVRSVGFKEV